MNRSTRLILRSRLIAALSATLSAILALATIGPGGVLAHGADPSLGGGSWYPGQGIPFSWAAGQVPPWWLQDAFVGAANQSNWTPAVRLPTFNLQPDGSSLVGYGEPTGCSSAGIACFSRNAPYSFRVWYRAHGYRFDWGTLLWCQGPSGYVDGCYDAQTVGLDELGHVHGLDHHLNYGDSSDYGDAVVQGVSRGRPRWGWDAHVFGRCDVARLQLLFDRSTTSAPFSSCLALSTTIAVAASAGSSSSGGSVLFSATLLTAVSSAAGALSGDPISGRTVVLERRFPGAATWTAVSAMTPQSTDGAYAAWATITGTYEWRASFPTPAGEGILGSSSSGVTVNVKHCRICPNAGTTLAGPQ